MRIRIFGAGPAGCRTAELLAKTGHEVTIYEEHKEIGKPAQCTGILTNAVTDAIEVPGRVVDHKVHRVRVHAPDGSHLKVKFSEPNLIVNRTKLDNWLAKRAERAGARIETETRLLAARNKLKVKTKQGTEYWKHETTIGADGPQSLVSRYLNPGFVRKYFGGLQITIRKENDGAIEFYPHIKDIAWATPESKTRLRVGVMSRGETRRIFDEFKKRYPGKVIAKQAGAIPYYQPELKKASKGFYTIGDAASMVKATTGGGLVQGLKAAPILAEAITNDGDYEKEWKRQQGRDLWLQLKIREKLDKFDDKQWNKLIADCNLPKIKSILDNIPRDYPLAMMTRLTLKKPGLMRYAFT